MFLDTLVRHLSPVMAGCCSLTWPIPGALACTTLLKKNQLPWCSVLLSPLFLNMGSSVHSGTCFPRGVKSTHEPIPSAALCCTSSLSPENDLLEDAMVHFYSSYDLFLILKKTMSVCLASWMSWRINMRNVLPSLKTLFRKRALEKGLTLTSLQADGTLTGLGRLCQSRPCSWSASVRRPRC